MFFLKRQENLCNEYSLVEFLFSPYIVTMKYTVENNIKEHDKEIKIFISKPFIDPDLAGQEKLDSREYLVDTFWKEYSYFTLRTKNYDLQTCGSFLKGWVHLHVSSTRPIQWVPQRCQ